MPTGQPSLKPRYSSLCWQKPTITIAGACDILLLTSDKKTRLKPSKSVFTCQHKVYILSLPKMAGSRLLCTTSHKTLAVLQHLPKISFLSAATPALAPAAAISAVTHSRPAQVYRSHVCHTQHLTVPIISTFWPKHYSSKLHHLLSWC